MQQIDAGKMWRDLFSRKIAYAFLYGLAHKCIPEKILEAVFYVSIGGANANDAAMINKDVLGNIKEFAFIDPLVSPAPSSMGSKNFTYYPNTFQELNPDMFKGGGLTVVEFIHVAQEIHKSEDLQKLFDFVYRIISEEGFAIFIEEEERAGLAGWYDYFLHYLYNNKGLLDFIQKMLEYPNGGEMYYRRNLSYYMPLIEKSGLKIVYKKRFYHRASFFTILGSKKQL